MKDCITDWMEESMEESIEDWLQEIEEKMEDEVKEEELVFLQDNPEKVVYFIFPDNWMIN